jgi:hypothetical protein
MATTTDRLIEELENEQHDGVDEVCVWVGGSVWVGVYVLVCGCSHVWLD